MKDYEDRGRLYKMFYGPGDVPRPVLHALVLLAGFLLTVLVGSYFLGD